MIILRICFKKTCNTKSTEFRNRKYFITDLCCGLVKLDAQELNFDKHITDGAAARTLIGPRSVELK